MHKAKSRRPLSITVAGLTFVVVGCASLAGGVWRFLKGDDARAWAGILDLAIMAPSALLALAGGAWLLRGDNRARWLLVGWMGVHIVFSLFHSPFEAFVHAVLFTGVLLLLFRPPASAFLQGRETGSQEEPKVTISSFRARLRFRPAPSWSLLPESKSYAFITQVPELRFTLEARGAGAFADAKWLILSVGGFPSPELAKRAGERARDALLWTSTRLRLGLDVGKDLTTSSTAQSIKDMAFKMTGKMMRDSIHGLDVYDESVDTTFPHLEARGHASREASDVGSEFTRAYEAGVSFSSREKLALEVFNLSFFEVSARARLLACVSAVEALVELPEMSEEARQLIDRVLEDVAAAQLSAEEQSSLTSRLDWLKKESIRGACKRMIDRLLPNKAYGAGTQRASKLFIDAYDERSKLVHEGRASIDDNALIQVAGSLSDLVADLLLAHVEETMHHRVRPGAG